MHADRKTVTSAEEAHESWAQQLHSSADGYGLTESTTCPESHKWLLNPEMVLPKLYVRSTGWRTLGPKTESCAGTSQSRHQLQRLVWSTRKSSAHSSALRSYSRGQMQETQRCPQSDCQQNPQIQYQIFHRATCSNAHVSLSTRYDYPVRRGGIHSRCNNLQRRLHAMRRRCKNTEIQRWLRRAHDSCLQWEIRFKESCKFLL
ncbi:unnamed protein product [Trichobilharzia regenti]|nr:unnamed protein product [Trichobilharzia regenti]